MKVASLETNLGWNYGLFSPSHSTYFLPLSGRSPNMTEILLTGTLSLNSVNQTTSSRNDRHQGSHWFERYLNTKDFLEKSLKMKPFLKSP